MLGLAQRVLQRSSISFGHHGVVVAEHALPRTDPSEVLKLISVAFLDSKEYWPELQGTSDRRSAFLGKRQHLKVRPAQVRKFPLFKKAIRDPIYANITIRDFDHELTTTLEDIPNIIFDQAIICDPKDEQDLEKILHDRTARQMRYKLRLVQWSTYLCRERYVMRFRCSMHEAFYFSFNFDLFIVF